ncbi:helix-turn-helix domain-containing protein [Micromonospora sp. M12]
MTADPADDTRTRIQRAALDLFAEHGYQRTSLRQIGERLRLTKAAILYHFPAKENLLAALVEPLLADLEALLDSAGRNPPRRPGGRCWRAGSTSCSPTVGRSACSSTTSR